MHDVGEPQVVGVGVGEGPGIGLGAGSLPLRPAEPVGGKEPVDRRRSERELGRHLAREPHRSDDADHRCLRPLLLHRQEQVLYRLGDRPAHPGVHPETGLEAVETHRLAQRHPVSDRRAPDAVPSRSRDLPLPFGELSQQALLLTFGERSAHEVADHAVTKERDLLAQRLIHHRFSLADSARSIPRGHRQGLPGHTISSHCQGLLRPDGSRDMAARGGRDRRARRRRRRTGP